MIRSKQVTLRLRVICINRAQSEPQTVLVSSDRARFIQVTLSRSATCLGRITVPSYQALPLFHTIDVIELLEAFESQ